MNIKEKRNSGNSIFGVKNLEGYSKLELYLHGSEIGRPFFYFFIGT
jgi:hypothetical protein